MKNHFSGFLWGMNEKLWNMTNISITDFKTGTQWTASPYVTHSEVVAIASPYGEKSAQTQGVLCSLLWGVIVKKRKIAWYKFYIYIFLSSDAAFLQQQQMKAAAAASFYGCRQAARAFSGLDIFFQDCVGVHSLLFNFIPFWTYERRDELYFCPPELGCYVDWRGRWLTWMRLRLRTLEKKKPFLKGVEERDKRRGLFLKKSPLLLSLSGLVFWGQV